MDNILCGPEDRQTRNCGMIVYAESCVNFPKEFSTAMNKD